MLRTMTMAIIWSFGIYGNSLSAQIQDEIAKLETLSQKTSEELNAISTSFNPKRSDLYIDKNWKHGIIITNRDEVIYISGRINVTRGYLECKKENKVRRVYNDKIKVLELDEKIYVPVKASSFPQNGANTYLSILSQGKIFLFERYYIEIKKTGGQPLNPQLTGNDEISVESDLFYSDDSGFQTVNELGKSKKRIKAVLGNRKEIDELIEINKLKFTSNRDIKLMFDHFNSLE